MAVDAKARGLCHLDSNWGLGTCPQRGQGQSPRPSPQSSLSNRAGSSHSTADRRQDVLGDRVGAGGGGGGAVQPDRGAGGLEGRLALGQLGGDEAGENVPCPGG